LQEAEERCCDADALRTFPALAAHYARALLATLDFVAPAPRLALAGTTFMDRGSLLRRFEMITNRRLPAPPTRRTRALVCAALLLTTPIARSVEATSDDAGPQPDQAVTIQMPDGALVEGRIASIKDGRVLVVMPSATIAEPKTSDADNSPDPAAEAPATDESPQAPAETVEADPDQDPATADGAIGEPWELSLKSCVEIALQRGVGAMLRIGDDNVLIHQQASPAKRLSVDGFRSRLETRIRDVEESYWELYFAYHDLEARKIVRDRTLEAWRRVKALERAGSAGGEANAEAQTRSQYYLCRAQVETALTNLFRVESRLRSVLGLAASDGRTIRPSDKPGTAKVKLDLSAIQKEARSNRVEMARVRRDVERRETELYSAQLALANAKDDDDVARRSAEAAVRQRQLLLDREKASLQDVELELAHQLGDALRDVDLTYSLAQTNFNRRAAAADEVEAVETLYNVGQVQVDRVIDAQARQAEAESAYHGSLADYARALLRVQQRKGSTLADYGYELAP
jgi:hypothetical protein